MSGWKPIIIFYLFIYHNKTKDGVVHWKKSARWMSEHKLKNYVSIVK